MLPREIRARPVNTMQVRVLLIITVVLASVLTLFLLLLATDTAMSVWQRLSLAPLWLQITYILFLLAIASAVLLLTWHWLKPARKSSPAPPPEADADSLKEDLMASASAGVDISAAVEEVREQQRRKQRKALKRGASSRKTEQIV